MKSDPKNPMNSTNPKTPPSLPGKSGTAAPRLIVVSAPSGAGKTTLCRRALSKFAPHLVLSISTTTRAPRGNEKEGQDYFFVSPADFETHVQKGAFAEHAEVHGNRYGTSRAFIEQELKAGRSVLLDIDVQGAAQLARSLPETCRRVFIAPPSLEALEARLRARGTDSDASVQRRLNNARQEMERSQEFDRVIINDDLERAFEELSQWITEVTGLG